MSSFFFFFMALEFRWDSLNEEQGEIGGEASAYRKRFNVRA